MVAGLSEMARKKSKLVVKKGDEEKIADTLRRLDGAYVSVGVHEQEGTVTHAETRLSVAAIATIHEFGTPNIPERSWLRAWADLESEKIRERMAKVLRFASDQKTTTVGKRELERIGIWAVGQIQKRIAQGIPPENADSTVRAKGSSTPLIDSGQFRQSITSKVKVPS